ncbi:hypothetical protein FSZ31_04385 [Sphingorhabdus soli]|uniref:DUF3168 domain-containing protein n=1 Tax=Flavisphingopyxis soli TaxID=2601267 RepID=A0A5C6UT79_9SPHN|nr:hypothetical protein [Sphingorhabdus soli]TXC73965.1 hypothetical protein FSZ31_04385 [Sphingorhabdus soli]
MEEDLIARLRAAPAIAAVAGEYDGRPTVDWIERRSDANASFPACVLSIVSPGRDYDQAGPSGLQQRRVRFECFGLSYGSAKRMSRAIIGVIEMAQVVGATRFHRGKLQFERDMPPEDIGGNIKVFRTVLDFFVPTTPTQ